MCRRRSVQRSLERCDERTDRSLVRFGGTGWRHGTAAYFPDDFLKRFAALCDIVQIHVRKRKPGRAQLVVVAADAILLEKAALPGSSWATLPERDRARTEQGPEKVVFKKSWSFGRQTVDAPGSTENGKVIKLTEIGWADYARMTLTIPETGAFASPFRRYTPLGYGIYPVRRT